MKGDVIEYIFAGIGLAAGILWAINHLGVVS